MAKFISPGGQAKKRRRQACLQPIRCHGGRRKAKQAAKSEGHPPPILGNRDGEGGGKTEVVDLEGEMLRRREKTTSVVKPGRRDVQGEAREGNSGR
jgi:hypothetical protein